MDDKHNDTDAKTCYADIFSLPHWDPSSTTPTGRLKHPRMSIEKRAAIFASFDALSGYKDATDETARITDKRIELSGSEKERLDQQLMLLIERMQSETDNGKIPDNIISADAALPPVTITYFSPDARKDGGEYRNLTDVIKKIDLYERTILLESGQKINLEAITAIRCFSG